MPKPAKIEAVAEFKERLEQSSIAIATQYVGINVADVTSLRSKLREQGVEYKVYKNTLALRALDEMNLSEAGQFLNGPTAWAFCKDPVAPAKVLQEFGKDVPVVVMAGGVLEGKVVSAAQLDALAKLPPRQVLLGQVAGTVAAPLRKLAGTLIALPRNLANVLDQVRKQKEEQAAA